MKLSHSRREKYEQCPKMYENHYNLKLRATTISSALFFGGYIGLVLNSICLRKLKTPTSEELEEIELGVDPIKYLSSLMENVEINGVKESLPKSSNIRYYRKDYNPDILTDSDRESIETYTNELGLFLGDRPAKFEDFISEYLAYKIDDTDIMSFMNFHFFLSLKRKGNLMINEFMERFFHKIIEVFSIEREINIDLSLEAEEEYTDSIIGYIDMECSYELCREYDKNVLKPYTTNEAKIEKLNKSLQKAHKNSESQEEFDLAKSAILSEISDLSEEMASMLCPGDIIKMTTDFKTSSTNYSPKKLDTPQLARYNFCAKNPYQGYIVFNKTVKTPKRGLRIDEKHCSIQVLFKNRDKSHENSVLDKDEIIIDKIQKGEFPRIPEKECKMQFGAYCSYYWYCHENCSMKGLISK